jgi:subtilisin family serine protease
MEAAVRSTINDHGISLIIAAGNSAEDSCGISPGNVPEAITVAASNLPNKFSTTRQGEGGAACSNSAAA